MKRSGGLKVFRSAGRRSGTPNYPPATRVVPHTSHLLISTGIRTLDKFLGGGLPCRTVTTLEIPSRTPSFCSPVRRYFASEGVVSGHFVLFLGAFDESSSGSSLSVSTDSRDEVIRKELLAFDYSAFLEDRDEEESGETGETMRMDEELGSAFSRSVVRGDIEDVSGPSKPELDIAFRYRGFVETQRSRERMREKKVRDAIRRPTRTASLGTVPCHRFDLSKGLQGEIFQEKREMIRFLSVRSPGYWDAVLELVMLSQGSQPGSGTVVRVVILPEVFRYLDELSQAETLKAGRRTVDRVRELMLRLRDIAHHSLAAVLACVPADLEHRRSRTSRCSDCVFCMRSFAAELLDLHDGAVFEEMRDWDGLFEIVRLPKTNSLAARQRPDQLTYVFRLGKRKLSLEDLSLGPEADGSRV